ncbi:DUF1134 domain-containing protein [Prosthecodimorpha staleyi]|uniref:DUF1134 domain-containing protein n=1 Tax=Prosthecodimorpha staleyi TaxID=2840188 RepID=A0A947GC12_9HYPH|nr:DUF1134 domain-containing protein [Prosthecodimorpha staleyi]MBT9289262.1 DUF1134 domain-containing protein [Prosthecodimorpha staleyi]
MARPWLTTILAAVAALFALAAAPAGAQSGPPGGSYSSNELISTGHRFFGTVSGGLATVIEKAVAQYGQPNGYILGEEGSGAIGAGLRYGEGTLHTRDQGQHRIFWQGPSLGWDIGGEGARTMMLVYNLPAVGAIYNRFGGVDGSAYFIGGFGMTALVNNNVYVVPVRAGVGMRLGVALGYLKFTPTATWNPF